jgi:tetratricopeptide (TPR) repeat protein
MQIYERALKNIPDFWVALNNLGFLLSENAESSEDLEEALKLTKKAQKLRPERIAVIDTLGWIYYKKGDNKRAFGLIEKALSSAPENPIFNYHMGMVLHKGGRIDEAGEKLKKSLESREAFFGREDAERTLKQIS